MIRPTHVANLAAICTAPVYAILLVVWLPAIGTSIDVRFHLLMAALTVLYLAYAAWWILWRADRTAHARGVAAWAAARRWPHQTEALLQNASTFDGLWPIEAYAVPQRRRGRRRTTSAPRNVRNLVRATTVHGTATAFEYEAYKPPRLGTDFSIASFLGPFAQLFLLWRWTDPDRRSGWREWTVVVVDVPQGRADLSVRPETWRHRFRDLAKQADIDFESEAFSRAFHVRSPDRRFAYAALPPRALESLLRQPTFARGWRGTKAFAAAPGRLTPERLLALHADLAAWRAHLPRVGVAPNTPPTQGARPTAQPTRPGTPAANAWLGQPPAPNPAPRPTSPVRSNPAPPSAGPRTPP